MTTALSRLNTDGSTPRTTPQFRPPRTSQYSISPGVSPISPMSDGGSPWPGVEGEAISSHYRAYGEYPQRRPARANSIANHNFQGQHHPPHPGRRISFGSGHRRSSSTTSTTSYIPGTNSPFPAPSKPLPALPPVSARSSQRISSQPSSSDKSSLEADRISQSSETSSSHLSRSSLHSISLRPAPLQIRAPLPKPPEEQQKPSALAVDLWKSFVPEKRKSSPVFYLDTSATGSTVAVKHGNNLVKFWNVETGTLQNSVKFSAYTEAHCRSRDYLIRSHAILSDTAKLAAIATRFGRSLEIWNWEKRKKLQMIDDIDRWAAGRFESYDNGWSPVAAYRGEASQIDLYAATDRAKKPFAKVRTIDLQRAGLPFVPQYPELALSPTSPLLVAAAGPRTPRAGHPPPDRETLLVVWEIHDYRDISHKPHRMVRPWQHKELDTAIPCNLVTYGNIIISIWIPASHRVVSRPGSNGAMEWKLSPTPVPFKHVLVWDMSENSTRSFGIPNTTACVSPDCRFVAYCDVAAEKKRRKLAIVDASSGEELWSVGSTSSSVSSEDDMRMMEQFGDLSTITNLDFSSDARFIVVGYSDGNTAIYDVRELVTKF
jgi:hypothetical protein